MISCFNDFLHFQFLEANNYSKIPLTASFLTTAHIPFQIMSHYSLVTTTLVFEMICGISCVNLFYKNSCVKLFYKNSCVNLFYKNGSLNNKHKIFLCPGAVSKICVFIITILQLQRISIRFLLNEKNKTKLESVKKADHILELPEEGYLVMII